jgi:hypothetical protein
MKRGTPDHPKVYDFAEALGVGRPTAIGYLELLFHFTSVYTPEGNIGKYSDKRISAGIDWHGKPERMVEALVKTGWLDRSEAHRLVVHDWSEHVDRSTKQKLARNGRKPVNKIQQVTDKSCTQSETTGTIISHLPEPEPINISSAAQVHSDSTQLVTRFQEFWEAYPKKVNREGAARAWLSLCGTEITESTIGEVFAGLERYKQSKQWGENGGKYIESPQTFLTGNEKKHGRMWKDHPPPLDGFERPAYDGCNPYAIFQPPEGVL